MRSPFKAFGLFLSSTDLFALESVGGDKFSTLKQVILGYSIFIPPSIAYFSFYHIFSLAIGGGPLVTVGAIVGALVVLLLDFSTVFFLSITRSSKLYFFRVVYSILVGFFLALVATVSLNQSYLNTNYQNLKSSKDGIASTIQKHKNTIAEYDKQMVDLTKNSKSVFNLLLLRRNLEKKIAQEELRLESHNLDDLFSELSFLYDEIILRKKYFLGFQSILVLLIIMSIDIIPILLKILGFETKYDVFLRVRYYDINTIEEQFAAVELEISDDILAAINSLKVKPEDSDRGSASFTRLLKEKYSSLQDQLHYFSKIRLLELLLSKTALEPEMTQSSINIEKVKSMMWVLMRTAIFTVPEFVFLVWWLSFKQVNGIAVYTSLFTSVFYINKLLMHYISDDKSPAIG